jgi:hypothetical protein
MKVGIVGWIGSGKDTVADYLVNFHQFRRASFAKNLKDAVSAVFGWDRELLEGRTKQSREWRDQVDVWWSQRLSIPNLTPRMILQNWGTEVIREHFHDDIWIASLENSIRSSDDDVVITDCRFPNEIQGLKSQGGITVWVRRGELPDWYDLAVISNRSNFNHMQHAYPEVHKSEWAWAGYDFDHVIENNGSIDELYANIRNLLQLAQAAN